MLFIMLRQQPGWSCWWVCAWLAQAAGQAGIAAEPASPGEPPVPRPDKSRYTLWNPTPRSLLREFSADRPDKTESAYTVDAGHFQVEMDLVSYTYDRDKSGGGDTRTKAWAIAPVNLKVGLFNDLDVQLVLETYNRIRTEDRVVGTTQHQSGFGDATLRLKKNFWGNDGGKTAFAMMPFLKFPANQDNLGNHAVEGGLIFPFSMELPRGWSLGAMTEVDYLRNDSHQGYHAAFINSITISRDLTKKLAGYVEFFSEVSTERGSRWVGTVDVGLTYRLTANVQLDAGVNLGVTRSADDVNLFLGLTWRY
jgi:hypothetical protein